MASKSCDFCKHLKSCCCPQCGRNEDEGKCKQRFQPSPQAVLSAYNAYNAFGDTRELVAAIQAAYDVDFNQKDKDKDKEYTPSKNNRKWEYRMEWNPDMNKLQLLGRDGWEAISVSTSQYGSHYWALKREITKD